MIKFTQAQQALLEMIANKVFEHEGLEVYGPHELRAAKALDKRGLATLDIKDRLTITPAGRAALLASKATP